MRNRYDPITNYMYEWSEPFIKIAENKGIKIDCVDEKKVIKKEVFSRIKKLNPNFIFLNGHGNIHLLGKYNQIKG